jgi:membrane protease YdiL (CAAX protease family)
MNPLAPSPLMWVPLAAFAAALAGSAFVWNWLARRRRRGIALLPYQPRRRVPWQGWDVLLVVVFYVLALEVAGEIVARVLGPDAMRPLPSSPGPAGPADGDDDGGHAQEPRSSGPAGPVHPLMRLLGGGDLWVQLGAALTAVVVAPVVEECFFRVLLQGWLEAAERRRRRRLPGLRRLLPHGAAAVIASSLVFACLHARAGDKEYPLPYVTAMLLGQAAASVLATAFALAWVRVRAGATPRDLGWAPEHLWSDVRTGLLAFAAVAVPTYALQFLFWSLLPKGVAADPAPLFFFALVLGSLYYRTHRIVPAIVLHMSLNACTLMLWLAGAA